MSDRGRAIGWLKPRPRGSWFVAVALLVTAGCADELGVEALDVRVKTGANSTDENIHICFIRLDTFEYQCINLDTEANDFESGSTDQFTVPMGEEISVDDAGGMPTVADVVFENHGGGFMSDGWDMTVYGVDAVLDDGTSSPICAAAGLSVSLAAGERYTPPECP